MKCHNDGTIYELEPNEVFVFGSNSIGAHHGGAAKIANEVFGYPLGISTGLIGQAYGIDTMSSKQDMLRDIAHFIDTAKSLPAVTFYLTRVGCGVAGYKDSEIAPLFASAPSNVIRPDGWDTLPNNERSGE